MPLQILLKMGIINLSSVYLSLDLIRQKSWLMTTAPRSAWIPPGYVIGLEIHIQIKHELIL